MRKDPRDNTVLEVTLKSRPEYLARIRTIASCLADSAGMDRLESDNAAFILTEACSSAMRCGSRDGASDTIAVALAAADGRLNAEITDYGTVSSANAHAAAGDRLMCGPGDDANFLGSETGVRVGIARRARRMRTLADCAAGIGI